MELVFGFGMMCGGIGEPLKEAFLGLFRIARIKDAVVADFIHF